jgi:pSer/pThr/pTyr-binding forkhead associated (FHA) protein
MVDARPPRHCAKGHAMDPNWDTCSYCEAEEKSKQRSTSVQNLDPLDRQRTMVGSFKSNPPEPQRETRAMAAPAEGHLGSGDTRRLTGILVTYTWRPEGEFFPVREGKTFIGSGDVSSEAFHRRCDVCLPHDDSMSAEHALILCRQGNYELLDQISSNGTFLAGQMLKANQGTDLPNYSEIKTGSTLWTFIMVKPPTDQAAPPGPRVAHSPVPSPRGKDPTEVR